MINNMAERLVEHWIEKEGCFTTRYKVYYLVWYETTRYVLNAIDREKAIKASKRDKKTALIDECNPKWIFRNEAILGNWPPTEVQIEAVKERWRIEDERGIRAWRPW
jgi:putative endonuclease